MKKHLVLVLSVVSALSYSQVEEITEVKTLKNSIGIDYRFEGGLSPNIGVTYRRFFEKSRYNLRTNFSIGSNNLYSDQSWYPYSSGNFLIYNTGDSSTPMIGVTEAVYQTNSYQRLEIGIEKESRLWKLNFISGADFTIGHRVSNSHGRITEVELTEIEQNGFKYYGYGPKSSDSTFPDTDLNYLSSTYNYFTFGANLRAGFKADLSNKLYATAFIGIRFESHIIVREKFEYKNELYKEHLPNRQGGSTFNFDTFASIGLHYRF